ncbi:MAG TPA: DUF350 domain-containing protein [Candidatus Paceibacterota bacterium]|nr:DUF350 domain-containing protein [Candidatus Paceibacterota bacterium]
MDSSSLGGLGGNLASLGSLLVALGPFLLIAIAALLVSDGLLSLRERASLKNEVLKGNNAIGLRRLGLFLGLMIGFSGVITGEGTGQLSIDLVNTAIYAAVLVALLQVAFWVNDVLILPKVANSAAVLQGNAAVATTELGSMVATGLIAKAAIEGGNGGVLPVLVFFALGQIALVVMTKLFSAIHAKTRLVSEIESGNQAAAIVVGAKLWAYGLIMATAAGGAFSGWGGDLLAFGLTALLGVIFLFISSWVVDFLLIRWHTLHEIVTAKSTPSALVFAGGQIGLAYAIATLIV